MSVDSPALLRKARAAAWVTFAMFMLGWVVLFTLSDPFNVLACVAVAQAISGIAAVVWALRWRRRTQGRVTGEVVTGLVFGVLGLLGAPLFWLLGAAASSGGGFGFGAWGRPLRVRGRVVHPRIRASDEWARGAAPDVRRLSPVAREALAAWWLRDAQKEHASVPAFARLAWQLTALGAPAELIERTYEAGRQEIEHARRCFALVTAYRGAPVGVTAMPELHTGDVTTDLVRLARESLVDGCFIEDLNADAAALAAERATDPAARHLCATIAVEERAHAELAWDLVAWCVREGGVAVERAVLAAAGDIPVEGGGLYDAELAALVARCEEADLHAHGRVPAADWPPLYRARLEQTRARLADLFVTPALAA